MRETWQSERFRRLVGVLGGAAAIAAVAWLIATFLSIEGR